MKDIYPFSSRFLNLGGVRCHYLDEGHGEVLVMVHGNPTWSFHFRRLVQSLRDRYRVVVPDHIGCGLSDKPQEYDYTLRRHINNLEQLIRELGLKRITLIMHDWGGPIGMGYAVRHPENVHRLVVFNTAAFWLPELPLGLHILRQPVIGPFLVRRLNVFARGAPYVACRRKRLTGKERAGYLAPYNNFANRVAVWRFIRDIPLGRAHPSFATLRDVEEGLPQLRDHPLLIIWGGRDPVFTYRFLDEWERRFPAAFVRVIEDAGHFVVEDGFDEILLWLNEFLRGDTAIRRIPSGAAHQNR